jgi:hypothetical protein
MDAIVCDEIESCLPFEVCVLVELYALEPVGYIYQLLIDCIKKGDKDAAKRVYMAFWADGKLGVRRNTQGRLLADFAGDRLAKVWSARCGRIIRALTDFASPGSRQALELVCELIDINLPETVQLWCDMCSKTDELVPGYECECHTLDSGSRCDTILCDLHLLGAYWNSCRVCGDRYCFSCICNCFGLDGPAICHSCFGFICPECHSSPGAVCRDCGA